VPGDSVPADQQAILQLKPGELTPVLPSTGGFFFYKLESQQQTALDAVHEQIATSLAQKKFQQEIEKLRKQYPVDLNTDFFGEALTPGMMAPGGAPVNMAPRPAAPQSQPVAPATK